MKNTFQHQIKIINLTNGDLPTNVLIIFQQIVTSNCRNNNKEIRILVDGELSIESFI